MSDLDTLKNLLVRVRKAEGPDHNLGDALKELVRSPRDPAAWISGCLAWNHGCPTVSIDAAVALVGRMMPNSGFSLSSGTKGSSSAMIEYWISEYDGLSDTSKARPSAPLALLDAMLGVLIQKAERSTAINEVVKIGQEQRLS